MNRRIYEENLVFSPDKNKEVSIDIDGDKKNELVKMIHDNNQNKTNFYINKDGKVHQIELDYGYLKSASLKDLNQDGKLEIILSSTEGRGMAGIEEVYSFDGLQINPVGRVFDDEGTEIKDGKILTKNKTFSFNGIYLVESNGSKLDPNELEGVIKTNEVITWSSKKPQFISQKDTESGAMFPNLELSIPEFKQRLSDAISGGKNYDFELGKVVNNNPFVRVFLTNIDENLLLWGTINEDGKIIAISLTGTLRTQETFTNYMEQVAMLLTVFNDNVDDHEKIIDALANSGDQGHIDVNGIRYTTIRTGNNNYNFGILVAN